MNLRLACPNGIHHEILVVSGSKSETNRLLILQALFPGIVLDNISDADDSKIMDAALRSSSDTIDVGHAGTAMRFLTAYFAAQEGRSVTLTGSRRMQQRPVKNLVEALQQLGAAISYENSEGYPPIRINGKKLKGGNISMDGNISSQYISALLLIAAKLEDGLAILIKNESMTSKPYVDMTMKMLDRLGIETQFKAHEIIVKPAAKVITQKPVTIESDWSSAIYFYAIVALSPVGSALTLSTFYPGSIQGDSRMADWFLKLGVETNYSERQITIRKSASDIVNEVDDWLGDNPDCIQTIFVMCFGLGIRCRISGAHTLRIKETDRIAALQAELKKLGAAVSVTDDSLIIEPCTKIRSGISISTYGDHRMAMSFAPLALKVPITIEDPEVVAKSYPAFWKDLEKIGFQMEQA